MELHQLLASPGEQKHDAERVAVLGCGKDGVRLPYDDGGVLDGVVGEENVIEGVVAHPDNERFAVNRSVNAHQSTDAFKPKAHAGLRRRQFERDDEKEGKALTAVRHPGLDDADGFDFQFTFQSEIGDAKVISRSRIER